MVRLNKNLKVNDIVHIGNWSWQVSKISGDYKIIAFEKVREYDESSSYILTNGFITVIVEEKTLEYFTGVEEITETNKIYNCKDVMPEKYEEFCIFEDDDTFCENNKIGFAYCGLFTDGRRTIEAHLPQGKWQKLKIKDWKED